jgi:hypothetical protein
MPPRIPPPGNEETEGQNVMIPARPLPDRSPSKLGSPDDEGVIEHAPLLEIVEERRSRAIDFIGRGFGATNHITVVIPTAMVQLDHTDAALRQPNETASMLVLRTALESFRSTARNPNRSKPIMMNVDRTQGSSWSR